MSASFVNYIKHIKLSRDYLEDVHRQVKKPILKAHLNKLEWMLQDLKANISFPADITEALRTEINSDPFMNDAISDKIALLHPMQRDIVETVIDEYLKGGSIEYLGEPGTDWQSIYIEYMKAPKGTFTEWLQNNYKPPFKLNT